LRGFSIVLCTYNGKPRLEPTLQHLAALVVPEGYKAELIVVDNACTDGTIEFVKDTWLSLGAPYQLQLLQECRPGKGYAVEMGYDAAQYSYILTVDDDNWLSPDYLTTAVALFEQHPDVGILQGKSIGVFETPLPKWAEELETFFVIGSPVKESGYFPKNYFGVWGAGMVIKNEDWKHLRELGFAFLTSKRKGKAAGEDHETAIGILLLGRRIFYSDQLAYKHFMPTGRITWDNLKNGFNIWGYLMYYNLLYTLVIDAHEKQYVINNNIIHKNVLYYFRNIFSRYTFKQLLAYYLMPREEFYQLKVYRDIKYYRWYLELSKDSMNDIFFLQKWITPLLDKNPQIFKMYYNI
jgi:glycosyltransferase involved in cell wall biosynthesis